ncbi:MAG: LemA family protein [Candidatus ainarchaeum sp.]|nr:LemA family protein [Candidatus ainarchaeum sp.]
MIRVSFYSTLKGLAVLTFFVGLFGFILGGGILFWPIVFFIGLAYIIASFYFSRAWFNADLLAYKIKRQPLTEIKNLTIDNPAAVFGTIECGQPLLAKYSGKPCVFYHYIKEKYIHSGKHSHWEISENITEYAKFEINDLSGTVSVDMRNIDSDLSPFWGLSPNLKTWNKQFSSTSNIANKAIADFKDSEVDAERTVFQEKTNMKNFFGINVGSDERVSEFVLETGEKVFVYGWVYDESGLKTIAESKGCPLIVSRKTKEGFLKDFSVGENFFYTDNFLILIGLAIAWFPLFLFFGLNVLFLGIAAILVFIKMAFEIYNRLIELNKRIGNAKSQISIELKKRRDLIPTLEKIVKDYAKYEKNLLEIISNLRADIGLDSEGMRKYSDGRKKITEILAMLEAYPAIKSNFLFRDFMSRLSQTEENIAYYRSFYNDTVLKYNIMIAIFPFNIMAKSAHLGQAEYWKSD